MNRMEFIQRLRTKLSHLPQEEIENAIAYYEEYFEDAGVENEEEILKQLDSPEETASRIVQDFIDKQANGKAPAAKKGCSFILLAVLAIFSAPIALPLAICILFAFILFFAAVLLCTALCFATGIFLLGGGIFIGWIGLQVFLLHIPTAIAFLGIALFFLGFGMLMLLGMILVARKGLVLCARFISRMLRKGRKAI